MNEGVNLLRAHPWPNNITNLIQDGRGYLARLAHQRDLFGILD
jgi:hypothetical protein